MPEIAPPPTSTGSPFSGPIVVFGCGLIGASLAGALTEAGYTVWGCDRRDLTPLIHRGWITRQVPPEGTAEATVVVLALPPAAIVGALRRFPFRSGQLVTDTGSVKGAVEEAARHLAEGVRFVGGHPLVGGTGSGFEAARIDLFRGAPWVLLPTADREAAAFLEGLLRRLGAEPLVCQAERHDRIVALTSHLPQLLSTVLAAEMASLGDDLVLRLLGAGGREFLRLARSPYPLWREIFRLNRQELAAALTALKLRASQPPEGLEEEFRLAREFMERLDRL